ncbi:MAG: DNA alkylation repair protein [Muribaculaceae bacterium]|nr:DNA alkylation repair protein [Muribaculaceae bacterium]
METEFSPMQSVKRRFFAMRNGVIADTLRRAGSPFRVIFGLNLPQIVEIAAEVPPDHARELAEALWANNGTRESMLIAPMLMPRDAVDAARAAAMLRETPCAEVADVLCHRLLRHMPYAFDLARELADAADPGVRYGALRLMFNIVGTHAAEAEALARTELDRDCPHTRAIAAALLDEATWLLGDEA